MPVIDVQRNIVGQPDVSVNGKFKITTFVILYIFHNFLATAFEKGIVFHFFPHIFVIHHSVGIFVAGDVVTVGIYNLQVSVHVICGI